MSEDYQVDHDARMAAFAERREQERRYIVLVLRTVEDWGLDAEGLEPFVADIAETVQHLALVLKSEPQGIKNVIAGELASMVRKQVEQ